MFRTLVLENGGQSFLYVASWFWLCFRVFFFRAHLNSFTGLTERSTFNFHFMLFICSPFPFHDPWLSMRQTSQTWKHRHGVSIILSYASRLEYGSCLYHHYGVVIQSESCWYLLFLTITVSLMILPCRCIARLCISLCDSYCNVGQSRCSLYTSWPLFVQFVLLCFLDFLCQLQAKIFKYILSVNFLRLHLVQILSFAFHSFEISRFEMVYICKNEIMLYLTLQVSDVLLLILFKSTMKILLFHVHTSFAQFWSLE